MKFFTKKITPSRSILSISLSAVLAACGGGGSSTPTTPPEPVNSIPVISSINANPTEAFNGDTITLTANATDADTGDTLTYDFSSNLGDITETTNTDSTSSVDCVEGLTTVNVTVDDANGGTATDSATVVCYLNTAEVKAQLVTNLGLTNVADDGTVGGMAIDFSGTATNGTVLGFAYNSAQDFSNHNDVSARGASGSPQKVISINLETDSTSLPTTFEAAQDLQVIAGTTKNKVINQKLLTAGTGSAEDVCVEITADETSSGSIENVTQTGNYSFEGKDTTTSILNFEGGLYSFTVAANGSVDLTGLAGQVYANIGAGVEELLNGSETNADGVINDACDTRVIVSPTDDAGLDVFGISKFYPTKSGSVEWTSEHWNNGIPRTIKYQPDVYDPNDWTEDHSGNTNGFVIDGAGIMRMTGSSPRFHINSLRDSVQTQFFLNTEFTAYYRRIGSDGDNWGGMVVGVRSDPLGHASNGGDDCDATTYYGRFRHDGKWDFEKELKHPTSDYWSGSGFHTQDPLWGGDPLPENQWIGMKYLAYNIENNTKVKLELYIDKVSGGNPVDGGVWEKVGEVIDEGNWPAAPSQISGCSYSDQYTVITQGHGTILMRTDGDEAEYKFVSIREIEI